MDHLFAGTTEEGRAPEVVQPSSAPPQVRRQRPAAARPRQSLPALPANRVQHAHGGHAARQPAVQARRPSRLARRCMRDDPPADATSGMRCGLAGSADITSVALPGSCRQPDKAAATAAGGGEDRGRAYYSHATVGQTCHVTCAMFGRYGNGRWAAEEYISSAVAHCAGAAGADAIRAGGAGQGGLRRAGTCERGTGGVQLGAWRYSRRLWSGCGASRQVSIHKNGHKDLPWLSFMWMFAGAFQMLLLNARACMQADAEILDRHLEWSVGCWR